MLEQFMHHLSHNNLCNTSQSLLLAISGGLDSMVMLNLFKRAGYTITVAHCNFQLRGQEADADEQFVKSVCDGKGITFITKRFDTTAYASTNKVSIQVAARELRYAWFAEMLDEHRIDYLATAHHVNDSIETVLLKWIHGASLESFGGIPVKNNRTIRPLLFATRTQLESYAQQNGLAWREDSSNASDDYQRNFIRHQIIPKLKEINPSLEATFLHAQLKVEGELTFLHDQVEHWKSVHVESIGNQMRIAKKAFASVKESGAALLWHVVREYGFNIDQCHNMLRALQSQSGKKFIGNSRLVTIDRDHLIISSYDEVSEAVSIQENETDVVQGEWELSVRALESTTISKNPMQAVLDASKIAFPITWRTWQAGDYFYPLGMDNRKKLSDFLIDKKISLADKYSVTVLESGGEIIWVVGHRIDNRFKITPETKHAISFTVQPYFA